MKLQASNVLHRILQHRGKRGIVLEGGSRSSKTWSIIQFLALYCQENAGMGKEIVIGRDRLTWLKLTVLRDFQAILKLLGWWQEDMFSKGSNSYTLFGNRFTFVGLDEPAKLHGLKMDIFWLNEVIGTPGSAYNPTKDTFDQLEQRTAELFFLDYNPKVTKHWVYQNVLSRPDVGYIHSTMLDNPFLELPIRNKIFSYEPTPINMVNGTADALKWKIYGLGLRAQHEGLVFTNVEYCKFFPTDCSRVWYGLDFGFTNGVTALVKVGMQNGELFLQQLLYDTGLTNQDISLHMKAAGLTSKDEVVADSAEMKSIEELKRQGWRVEAAIKGPDSIKYGIDVLQRYKINVVETSLDVKTEFESYVWKDNPQTNQNTNTPIDAFNHAIDALRYVALNKIATPRVKKLKVSF